MILYKDTRSLDKGVNVTPLTTGIVTTTRAYRTGDGFAIPGPEVFEARCKVRLDGTDPRLVVVTLADNQGFAPQPMWVWLKELPSDVRETLIVDCHHKRECTLKLAVRPNEAERRVYLLGVWSPQEWRYAPFFGSEDDALTRSEAA